MNRPIARTIVVLATLLAIGLGGSVNLAAQVWLAAIAGLLLLILPPRGPLPRGPLILAAILLVIALFAYLPSGAAGIPDWRKYLAVACHIPGAAPHDSGPYLFPIADTWTPQPWLTLQACALLFVGLAWGLYLFAFQWEREDRMRAAELLVFGVSLLALWAALAFILNFRIWGWTQTENRGWFPNRNQTADVLALTGIVAYALIFDRLRKGKRTGYLLLGALVPIVVELVISYSRAGVLLFFGGVLVWHLWPRPGATRRSAASFKWLALSAALGIVLLSIFLTFGGETLTRFTSPGPGGSTTQDITDYRGAIQMDALRFSIQSPVLGTGLGNFEPLFSFSRVDSINGNRAVHPESDWLWLAGEMGWGSVILFLLAYLWWLRRALPLENKTGESVRRALIVAGLVFAVHGLVDVSAHRPGSLWPALLILGMALPVRRDRLPSRATPVLFRILGLLVLLIAGWWGASLYGLNVPPTTATLDRLKGQLQSDLTPPDAIKAANDALRLAPLDWSLYLQRGHAETKDHSLFEQAQQDFNIADALNPYWIALPIDEGQAWKEVNEPGLGVEVWTQGLKRTGPLSLAAYHDMVGLSIGSPIMHRGLAELGFERLDYLLAYLPEASTDEADVLIRHTLRVDPTLASLTPAQRHDLFAGWWSRGTQANMMEVLHDHPEWDAETWLYQAKFAAAKNDFEHACAICNQHVKAPVVPPADMSRPLATLAADFQANPSNFSDGLALFLAQTKSEKTDDALATLAAMRKLTDLKPSYLGYMEAQLQSAKGDWAAAWNAWQNYLQP